MSFRIVPSDKIGNEGGPPQKKKKLESNTKQTDFLPIRFNRVWTYFLFVFVSLFFLEEAAM